MSEAGPFSLSASLSAKMEQWKVPETFDLEELTMMAGSISESVRDEALELLRSMWAGQPERLANSKEVKRVDIMEQLEQLPLATRKVFLEEMYGIQLTQGCNGGCIDCMFGRKKGVTHKYTYDSLVRFFKEYGKHIGVRGITMALYGDSDPFDYRDGDRTILDVYRLASNHISRPDLLNYAISTALPPGGQADFVMFWEGVLADYFQSGAPPPYTRLSVWKHNIQRVDACLKVLRSRLHHTYPSHKERIDKILREKIAIAYRDDSRIQALGDSFGRADPMLEIGSVAAIDGCLMTPVALLNQAVIAATPFSQSGYFEEEVAGRVFQQNFIATHGNYEESIDESNYEYVINRIGNLISKRSIFLRPIIEVGGVVSESEASVPIKVKIARRCKSMQLFLDLCSLLNSERISTQLKDEFFEEAGKEWSQIVLDISGLLNGLEAGEDQLELDEEYIVDLLLLLEAKVNYVFSVFEEKGQGEAVFAASVMNFIGGDQAGAATEIFSEIDELFPNKLERKLLEFKSDLSELLLVAENEGWEKDEATRVLLVFRSYISLRDEILHDIIDNYSQRDAQEITNAERFLDRVVRLAYCIKRAMHELIKEPILDHWPEGESRQKISKLLLDHLDDAVLEILSNELGTTQ